MDGVRCPCCIGANELDPTVAAQVREAKGELIADRGAAEIGDLDRPHQARPGRLVLDKAADASRLYNLKGIGRAIAIHIS